MTEQERVVVAMSGGVDSSVAAALLKEQGYEVIGMMMRLWNEPGSESSNRCCTPDAMAMARRVAAKLSIPFYAIDAKEEFHHAVVKSFLQGYRQGITPNPCLVCNRHIRWEFLLNRALAFGAGLMATGHYARLQKENGHIRLLRAVDQEKDQSYVLHVLNQRQLSHALLPLGDYTKSQIRQIASDFGLPVANRSESQDLCFIGKGDTRGFLSRNAPGVENPGPIITRRGEILGQHQGLAFYTIGQRKGLGIAAPHPLYVVDKDLRQNTLVVGKKEELGHLELTAQEVNWISGEAPIEPFSADIMIRYRARIATGVVTPMEDRRVHIQFAEPLRDITPGQGAVLYLGEVCLGGGIIDNVRKIHING